MTSREALRRLNRSREKLRTHHVRHIAVFGSTARDQATFHSDVDLLVEFEPGAPVGLFAYVRLLDFLTSLMDTRIDLATPGALDGFHGLRVCQNLHLLQQRFHPRPGNQKCDHFPPISDGRGFPAPTEGRKPGLRFGDAKRRFHYNLYVAQAARMTSP